MTTSLRIRITSYLCALKPTLDLYEASAVNDAASVKSILARDPHAHTTPAPDGFFALGLAAFFGSVDVLLILLDAGADGNAAARNDLRVCPLHSAAAHADVEKADQMVALLLARGANPDVKQQGGWTPLHQAAAHGRVALAGRHYKWQRQGNTTTSRRCCKHMLKPWLRLAP